jgi:hypothetical protein
LRTKLSILFLILTTLFFTQPVHAITVGTNINLIPAPDRQQAETTVAVDPRNPLIIVAGAQDYNLQSDTSTGCCSGHRWHAIYRSTDGGQTWSGSLLPGFPGDNSPQGANSPLKAADLTSDPVMAFDNSGNLYYGGIALGLHNGFAADFVAKYANDGANYIGVAIIPGFGDFPKIAVDKTGGIFNGNIYLISSLGLSISTDGGNTFSALLNIKSTPQGPICCGGGTSITVDPSGVIMIVGVGAQLDSKTGQETFFVYFTRVNLAAKGNFDDMVSSTTAATPITILNIRFLNNLFRVGTFPEVAADASGVYVVWSDNRTGDADVLSVRSTDGGSTWSSPLRVNDVASGQQFFPTIVASGGVVSVAWYDSRLTTNTNGTINALDVYYAESNNAGQSFSANVRVTSVSFNPNQARINDFARNAPFIGDYISIAAENGLAHPVWADDRNTCDFVDPFLGCVDEDIFTAAITV